MAEQATPEQQAHRAALRKAAYDLPSPPAVTEIPHKPAAECGERHCWWHHVDESPDGAYRVCFECKHAYRTAEDLRAAWAAEVGPAYAPRPAPPTPPTDEIWACPLCSHDF